MPGSKGAGWCRGSGSSLDLRVLVKGRVSCCPQQSLLAAACIRPPQPLRFHPMDKMS